MHLPEDGLYRASVDVTAIATDGDQLGSFTLRLGLGLLTVLVSDVALWLRRTHTRTTRN